MIYRKLLTLDGLCGWCSEYRGIQNSQFLRPALYVLLAEPTELPATALSGDDFLRP